MVITRKQKIASLQAILFAFDESQHPRDEFGHWIYKRVKNELKRIKSTGRAVIYHDQLGRAKGKTSLVNKFHEEEVKLATRKLKFDIKNKHLRKKLKKLKLKQPLRNYIEKASEIEHPNFPGYKLKLKPEMLQEIRNNIAKHIKTLRRHRYWSKTFRKAAGKVIQAGRFKK